MYLSSIASGFFGRKIGISGSRILSCITIFMTTTFAIIGFFEFTSRFTYLITYGNGRSYTCFCINSCCYYGYSWSIFINTFITIDRI
ncbi:hypothetical protein LLEC1_05030 [Akanthomyces lecanii]|uniref:Uncharacterized protein n=1 Tax=Cordyceps confragosa TaxID=2714763 RepID=A0A179IU85_CORDF|nr:hypothetical protein LLEC1_05030 [Akanthomyces lecanii]